MSSFHMLDVAIGMTFVFLLISLICTALNELLEAAMKNRAKDLEKGLRELIGTSAATEPNTPKTYLEQFYQHPLVNSLFPDVYQTGTRKLPSYIPARTFALAIMDVVLTATPATKSGAASTATSEKALGNTDANQAGPNADATALGAPNPNPPLPAPNEPAPVVSNPLTAFRDAVAKLPDDLNLKRALLTLTDAAGDDIAAARANIENWYNGAMDRVSGWYKRRAQAIIFAIGCLSAIALNADALAIFKSLINDSALRDSVVAAASSYKATDASGDPGQAAAQSKAVLDASLTQLEALKLPIGWDWKSKTDSAARVRQAKADSATAVAQAKATSATAVAQAKGDSVKVRQAKADSVRAVAQAVTKSAQAIAQAKAATATLITNKELAVPSTGLGWLQKVLGWLITGIAVSLGAPFWFDVLNKFMVVRSTVKPHEKSMEESSEDHQGKKK
jgi:hypothetical protein